MAEVVTVDEFRDAVRAWVQTRDSARRELAARFDASLSTVDRWWLGTNSPHPLLRVAVVEWIREQKAP